MSTTPRMRRWVTYVMAGVLLGLANWFAPQFVRTFGTPNLNPFLGFPMSPWMRLVAQWPIYLLWALPALFVAAQETHQTRQPGRAAWAVVLLWLSAMVTYYAIYSGKLLLGFGGDQLLVRLDDGWATYWQDISRLREVLQGILDDFLLWGSLAVVAGAVFGWIVARVALLRSPASRP